MSAQETRPTNLTPEMALRAAMPIAERLIANGMEGSVDDIAQDIAKYGRTHMDGYELAKTLDDRRYWNCDFQTAEDLDGFASSAYSELERAQKEWVERNGITPQHPVGTRVKLRSGATGVITGIYEHGPAQYLVKIDGQITAEPPANARRIVNFEDASLCDAEPVTPATER